MPPKPVIALENIDPSASVLSKDEVLKILPQRHEFEMIDRLVWMSEDYRQGAAVRFLRDDEFWIRGHLPGRPMMPGVLLCEMAAQLGSLMFFKRTKTSRFLGFAGISDVKFRGIVRPGETLLALAAHQDSRLGRETFRTQIFSGERMIFEGVIQGMVLRG